MKKQRSKARESMLSAGVAALRGVGPARVGILADQGIRTLGDLLEVRPRRYRTVGSVLPIAEAREGETVAVLGRIVSAGVTRPRGRRRSAFAEIEDDTGGIRVVWFNQGYLRKQLKKGRAVAVEGRVRAYKEELSIAAEVYEFDPAGDFGGKIIPFYDAPEGFPPKTFGIVVREAVESAGGEAPEIFSEAIRERRSLPGQSELLRMLHRPADAHEVETARRALVYEELFLFEAALALRRRRMERARTKPVRVTPRIDARIRRLFPFTFTNAQDRVIAEIAGDLRGPHPMNRLLQGDVGSGKTVVALYALLAAVAGGRQGALMAPTEVLAEQHFRVLAKALARARVRVELIKSGMDAKTRAAAREALQGGRIDIAVGTHALLEEKVRFADLAVVVIDEQHKFGVLQRRTLAAKGRAPHTLVMTATPIPRTLALTVFGDLAISTIDEMPPGRSPVATTVLAASRRDEAHGIVRREVETGGQAYIVYPVIDDSEILMLAGARQMHEKLARGAFSDLAVGLIHGAMKSAEKGAAMEAFAAGKTNILVATTVIEVGMDVPNATVMVIEHADRFGLAQLHQLRGRVGRGKRGGVCLLVSASGGLTRRLRIVESTNDGFRIAQEDMKIRGPGEFFGVQQHGLPDFQLANVVEDWDILEEAREDAFAWAYGDARFEDEHRRLILQKIRRFARGGEGLVDVG